MHGECTLSLWLPDAPQPDASLPGRPAQEPERTGQALEMPVDLRKWFCPNQLQEWAEQEVAKLRWHDPQVVAYLRAYPDLRSRAVLVLLTFAYAAAIFSSEEIVQACHSDADFLATCAAEVPFTQELRNFRRNHRPVLEATLAGLFARAVSARFDLSSDQLSPELRRDLWDHAIERLNIARHMDAAEV